MKYFFFFFLFSAACASVYGLSRIVGGIESSIEKRPFQASLQSKGILGGYSHSCGASILNEKHLLTAAHCKPSSASGYYARVGSTQVYNGGQVIKVSSFVAHPEYSRNTLDYDFCIVTLAENIVFGPNVVPVTLADDASQDPPASASVTVSGWGVTSESSSTIPTTLREVDLPTWNNDKCKGVYSFLTSRQICLGGTPIGGTSACFGDSGGPATFGGIQVGLVSGGNSCSAPNIPGIYARISSVRAWIKANSGA